MTQVAAKGLSFSSIRASTQASNSVSNSGPVILLYHRVANPPMDPQCLCVGSERFAEQLRALNSHGRIISMRELVTSIRDQIPLPSDAFVITFDDGYADNVHQALPLLEADDAPATVFVATGDLDVEVEYWWDQLERITLVQKSLPTSLTLRLDEQTFTWTDDSANAAGRENQLDGNQWNVLSAAQPTSRQLLYRELFALLRPLSPVHRQPCMEQLNQWAGVKSVARESHRRMTRDEVAKLARCNLIDIGAHTVNHPVLSALPVDDQIAEICESKQAIEDIIGIKVSSFSYPFGCKRDYTDATVQAVRHAGFSSACANFSGVVNNRTSLFELPRVLVRDWPAKTLLKCIDEVRCVRHACG